MIRGWIAVAAFRNNSVLSLKQEYQNAVGEPNELRSRTCSNQFPKSNSPVPETRAPENDWRTQPTTFENPQCPISSSPVVQSGEEVYKASFEEAVEESNQLSSRTRSAQFLVVQ